MPMEPGFFAGRSRHAPERLASRRVGRTGRPRKARPGNRSARKHNRDPAAPYEPTCRRRFAAAALLSAS
jgi:hypothetical protein